MERKTTSFVLPTIEQDDKAEENPTLRLRAYAQQLRQAAERCGHLADAIGDHPVKVYGGDVIRVSGPAEWSDSLVAEGLLVEHEFIPLSAIQAERRLSMEQHRRLFQALDGQWRLLYKDKPSLARKMTDLLGFQVSELHLDAYHNWDNAVVALSHAWEALDMALLLHPRCYELSDLQRELEDLHVRLRDIEEPSDDEREAASHLEDE